MELDSYDYFEFTFFDATNQAFNTIMLLASPKGHQAKLALMS